MKERIEKLKNDFVSRVEALDRSSMGLGDLIAYADLLQKASDLFQPSHSEVMMSLMSNVGCVYKRGDNDG